MMKPASFKKQDMPKLVIFFALTILLYGCFSGSRDYARHAVLYRYMGEYDKAIDLYSQAIELNPKDAEIYNDRGLVYLDKNEYDSAISDFNRAIELDSNLYAGYNNRGIAYDHKGDYQKAISNFNQSIEIKKDYAMAYVNRGLAFYRSGNDSRAIDDYTRAIEIKSNMKSIMSAAYFNRGLVYSSKGDCAKAINDFDNSVQVDRKSVRNLVEVALVLSTSPDGRCRDGSRAVKFAEEAVRMRKTASVLQSLAAAYAEENQFEKAIRLQEEAISFLEKGKRPILSNMEYYKKQLQSYKNSVPWRITPKLRRHEWRGQASGMGI